MPEDGIRSRKPDFHDPVRRWFEASFPAPTRAQALAWPPILEGRSTLLLAPTGSGKTLAAFLTAIDRLMFQPAPAKKARCRVVYVSPLKALAADVERNLQAPLAGIGALPGVLHLPSVAIRTGDTPAGERAQMSRAPPDILITTPESLFLILTSQAREMLRSAETVIVDEIHSLVPTKRGAHLFLSLERLEELAGRPVQRIGLSATQRPLDEVARLLGGGELRGKRWTPRPVTVIDAGARKQLEVRVEMPSAGDPETGAWPQIHPRLLELIRANRSTMIFVNSRRLAERLAGALNELAGSQVALAHHGSVAREKRREMEERLKAGALPAIVATSSLELGIDMGAVELVVQIEAPPSIASGLQRIGRAFHQVGGVPRGVVFPKHRGDLLVSAAAASGMALGQVEETFAPRNPLDVLAQQLVAICAERERQVDEVYSLVRGAAPFADLPRSSFDGVLDMLSGRYPSDEFAELRPRLTWDRLKGTLQAREGAQRVAVANAGTIPDRGLYGVFFWDGAHQKRVGELDEEMVFESRVGDVFVLGASSWRIDEITQDKVLVSPAPGEPGKMPFWHGDRPGRPLEFGMHVGRLSRELAKAPREKALQRLRADGLDEQAAAALVHYLHEQAGATGEVPSDEAIIVERYLDDVGDWRVCVMTPFGARVHAPWTVAVTHRLESDRGRGGAGSAGDGRSADARSIGGAGSAGDGRSADARSIGGAGSAGDGRSADARSIGGVETMWSDDGMVFRLPESDEPPDPALLFPKASEVEDLVTQALGQTSLFAARFRENAARALLLPRRHPGRRSPLWSQRKRARDLLQVAAKYGSFPILLETYRECLRDVFDLPALQETLKRVESRSLRVVALTTRKPSPFAASLLFSYVANFIYDGDAPLAERRAQALSVDQAQLRELLGEAEMRELLDAESIEAHERGAQRRLRPARGLDGLHDLLLALGDLSEREVRERFEGEPPLAELLAQRRAFALSIGGEQRFAAAEDAARYRDGASAAVPAQLPRELLAKVAAPLEDLVSRWARTHGPFRAEELAARWGIDPATVRAALERLAAQERVLEGEFLPHGRGREWVDAEVLKSLRRRSLAKLRKQVEPVEPPALARFLAEWHGVARPRRGMDALLDAAQQLQGAPLLLSSLEREVLAARIQPLRPGDLDLLFSAGELVWRGIEPIGARDGRIALYLTDHFRLLAPPPRKAAGSLCEKLRAQLQKRGASFFADLQAALGAFNADLLAALWDLVWSGEVTNDTLAPLRSRMAGEPKDDHRRDRRFGVPFRSRRVALPGSEGRWSLLPDPSGSPTERAAALARSLLARHGIVTRESARAEEIGGGFAAVYPVLRAMEEAGKARRGYFVAGLGGAQFAMPGAEDRLRALRENAAEPQTLVLAATDPANPYGATVPWPRTGPQRAAGAQVVLHDGRLLGWLGRNEQNLESFAADAASARLLAQSLAALVDGVRRRALLIARVDGREVAESPLAPDLRAAGFTPGIKGYLRRAAAGVSLEDDDELE